LITNEAAASSGLGNEFLDMENNYAGMSKRKSFDIEGLGHANPIPAVSRIGNIVATGGGYPERIEARAQFQRTWRGNVR
jgi:hypothetical protein